MIRCCHPQPQSLLSQQVCNEQAPTEPCLQRGLPLPRTPVHSDSWTRVNTLQAASDTCSVPPLTRLQATAAVHRHSPGCKRLRQSTATPQAAGGAQAPTGAQGFRNTATKWLTLVRLLLGEVPAHQDFKGAGVERSLASYFRLSQAVRLGDLIAFKCAAALVLEPHRADLPGAGRPAAHRVPTGVCS